MTSESKANRLKERVAELDSLIKEYEGKIEALNSEIAQRYRLLVQLSTKLYGVSKDSKNLELHGWIVAEVKRNNDSANATNEALKQLEEEQATATEDSLEDRAIHLEHLFALQKNLHDQLELRSVYLFGAIKRMRAKLSDLS